MNESLTPQERIKKKRDFLFIYKNGHRFRGKYFTLVFLINNLAFSRVAVVAGRKVGNAVARNRVKRWMRELFRRNKSLLAGSCDVVCIAKKEMLSASWPAVKEQYLEAIKTINKLSQAR